MNQFNQQFDALLEETIPEADQTLKIQNIASSTQRFSKAYRDSRRLNKEEARQMGNSKFNSLWRFIMNENSNRQNYHAFATLAIAFIAVALVMQLPPSKTQHQTITPTQGQTSFAQNDSLKPATQNNSNLEEIIVTGSRVQASSALREAKEIATHARTERPSKIAAAPIVVEPLTSKIELSEVTESGERSFSSADVAYDSAVASSPTIISNQAKSAVRKKQSVKQIAPSYSDSLSQHSSRLDQAEEYAEYEANSITQVANKPVSTFSIDVDTASYSLIRSQLNSGYLPKPQAVRAEELINYFNYDYFIPKNKSEPFSPTLSVLDSPWNKGKKLIHIGIKGYDLKPSRRPDVNLVFLLDVSGSMNQANKLPLVKQSLSLLLDTLKPTDTISIAVYAGAAGTVLAPTPASNKATILRALNNLSAGGSTAGGQGLRLAYQLAEQNLTHDGINRIILATDGDFNVGQSSNEDLQTLVERKRDSGVFLSVLGFGRNNYQDDMMQTLAQNGNGIAAYIDTLSEAKKVLVDEANSALFPIAKDVKIQIEFNPATVSDYRLIGYETRALKREDFNNDQVDAGDVGAGHTVTAIYEITPTDATNQSVDALRYQTEKKQPLITSNEYGFLKIRYKLPKEKTSRLIQAPITNTLSITKNASDIHFSIAVAGFAQLLANNPNTGKLNYDNVIQRAAANKGSDEFGYRSEFIQLVRMAKIAKP